MVPVRSAEPKAAHLKAVNVEVEAEGLYDHGGPLPQRMPAAGTQLFPTDTPTETNTKDPFSFRTLAIRKQKGFASYADSSATELKVPALSCPG